MTDERHLVLIDAIQASMDRADEIYALYQDNLQEASTDDERREKRGLWWPGISIYVEKCRMLLDSLFLEDRLQKVKAYYDRQTEDLGGNFLQETVLTVVDEIHSYLSYGVIVRSTLDLAEPVLGIARIKPLTSIQKICERFGPFVRGMMKEKWVSMPGSEPELGKVLHQVIRLSYLDALGDKAVWFPDARGKRYFPDVSIPSLKLAIELKLATSEAELIRSIDQTITDIGVYGDPVYTSLALLIYGTDDSITEEVVRQLWEHRQARLGGTKFKWQFWLTRGPAERLKKSATV